MAKCNSYAIPRYGKLGPNTLMVREREVLARICDNLISKGAKPTEAQRLAQMAMANNMLIWRCFSHMLSPTFPDRKIGQTEYNAFMSDAMKKFSIFITKEMVQDGATVLAPVKINTGTLRPQINYWKDASEDWMVTSILLGDLVIDEDTTVGEFTQAVVQCNGLAFRENKEHVLGYFRGHQSIDINSHYPTATMEGKRLVLNPKSTAKLWETVEGSEGFRSYKGHLATPYAVRDLYAWIHLAKSDKNENLSTSQALAGDNNAIIAQYTTEEAFLAACESYGGFKTRFLAPFEEKIHPFDYTVPTETTVAGQNPEDGTSGDGGNSGNPDPTEGEEEGGSTEGGNGNGNGGGQTPGTVDITVACADPASGTPYGGGQLTPGSEAQIGVTPKFNWNFIRWNDGDTHNPRTITVPSENTTYTATLQLQDQQKSQQ